MNNVFTRQVQGSALMTFLGLTLLIPSLSWAVSLGRLSLNSALNQPLDATIEVTHLKGLSSEEIRVGLAPREAFEALGVHWSYSLDDLSLRIDSSPRGAVVSVTTDSAIVEPYLNFVIEVLWPQGRVIREYTALLDPPVLDVRGGAAMSVGEAEDIKLENASRPLDFRASGYDRMTQTGDTLWKIALAARPSPAISVQEMMLAIQRLNPEAFVNSNINGLKAGYLLQMPTGEEFSRLNTVEALAEVAEQNRALNLDQVTKKKAVEPNLESESSAALVPDSQLVILAEDPELADEPTAPDTSAAAIETALMRTESEVTQAAKENAALQSRLSAFEAQLGDLAGAVTIKDAQIARLEKQLADLERPARQVENPFLATTTIGLLAIVVVLFVGLLLVSARLRRLSRNLQLTPSDSQHLALEPESETAMGKPSQLNDSAQSRAELSDNERAENSGGNGTHPTEGVSAPDSEMSAMAEDEISESPPEDPDDDMIEIDLGDLEGFDELEELDLDGIEVVAPEAQDQEPSGSRDERAVAEADEMGPDEDPTSMLDLARAYIEMEHHQEAKKLLARVIQIGLPHEIADAEQMLASLGE